MPLYTDKDSEREIKTENGNSFRCEFRRDFSRLIHSPAFRRLQGKTQLFPGNESDFFRNRMTHSLEVAQIAKSIALKLNNEVEFFRNDNLDVDIVETAGLVHDLGHPPFGHNGEMALDDCMKKYGGFEGNAQTLRILARLEKKEMYKKCQYGIDDSGIDQRAGLNLTYRTLAAAIKYDNEIPKCRRTEEGLVKGYYTTEKTLVDNVRKNVLGAAGQGGKFKTVECQIMDAADDIAYSTYDLEDSLKAGFLTPLDLVSTESPLLNRIAKKVSATVGYDFSGSDVVSVLLDVFEKVFQLPKGLKKEQLDCTDPNNLALIATQVFKVSQEMSSSGYLRTGLTSALVNEFISGIETEPNEECPPLSKVSIRDEILEKVEVLKHYTFEATIMSSRLKVVQHRGYDIVKTIFEALASKTKTKSGYQLLPDDYRNIYNRLDDESEKMRAICDFIAGMTDRYAVEFYARLTSENAQTIFKPL